MGKKFSISDFNGLKTPEKLEFLNEGLIEFIDNNKGLVIDSMLSDIILNSNENSYVRKLTLKHFTNLVIVGELKIRHAYTLLIDKWLPNEDVFLELQRLKDLLIYYNPSNEESGDIESIFEAGSKHTEAEIAGECFHCLGIIYLIKGFGADREQEYEFCLNKSDSYFVKSIDEIENRIDSKFYRKIITILKGLLHSSWRSATYCINELANDLFRKEVFSFDNTFNNLQFGFYKMLISLQKICNQQPRTWIDYRFELDRVYLNFNEIINLKVTTRLNEKNLLEKVGFYFKECILEPFYIYNLSSDIEKIDVLIKGEKEDSTKWKFLNYVKTVIQNGDKKKEELELIKAEFKELFKKQNSQAIENIIREAKEPLDYVKAFRILNSNDNQNLIEHLMFACSKLQADKKYWGSNANENDRNRYLANLIESAGYNVKDQNQWSTSYEGKDSGEIDVFVNESNGAPMSIIEALNLDSLRKDYIILHLNKLFKYDTTGLKSNYIIVYSLAKNFIGLWERYCEFISSHNYEYKFLGFEEQTHLYTDIKIGVSKHLRNKKEVELYHIMVNMRER